MGLLQISDQNQVIALVDSVLEQHPKQLSAYRGGKQKLFGFFVGQVMRVSEGRANPAMVNAILKDKLQ